MIRLRVAWFALIITISMLTGGFIQASFTTMEAKIQDTKNNCINVVTTGSDLNPDEMEQECKGGNIDG